MAAITATGLILRVAFVAAATKTNATGDAGYYFDQAKFVAAGKGFLEVGLVSPRPSAYHPPGQVVLLSALRLVGLNTPQSERYALCMLGSATIVVTAMLVRRLVSPRAGLFAGLLVAIYPPIWINDRMLMSETMFLLAFSLVLWFAYAAMRTFTARNIIGLSLAIGVAASARPESMLLYGLIALPVVLARSELSWKRRLRMLGLVALVPVMLFTPWVVYNQRRFHAFVPMSTGFGPTLLAGNCSTTYYGPFKGYYSLRCNSPNHGAPTPQLDEVVDDRNTRDAAFAYMRTHLKRLPMVVALREARIWGIYDPRFTVSAEAHIERRIDIRLAWAEMWSYWIVALLAIPGFFVLRHRRVPTYPILAMIGTTAFIAGLTFGLTRYRVGADLGLVIFASATLDCIAHSIRQGFLRMRHGTTKPQGPVVPCQPEGSDLVGQATASARPAAISS